MPHERRCQIGFVTLKPSGRPLETTYLVVYLYTVCNYVIRYINIWDVPALDVSLIFVILNHLLRRVHDSIFWNSRGRVKMPIDLYEYRECFWNICRKEYKHVCKKECQRRSLESIMVGQVTCPAAAFTIWCRRLMGWTPPVCQWCRRVALPCWPDGRQTAC